MLNRQPLGRQFAQHNMQVRNNSERNNDRDCVREGWREDSKKRKERCDDICDERLSNPPETEAGHRYSQLCRR